MFLTTIRIPKEQISKWVTIRGHKVPLRKGASRKENLEQIHIFVKDLENLSSIQSATKIKFQVSLKTLDDKTYIGKLDSFEGGVSLFQENGEVKKFKSKEIQEISIFGKRKDPDYEFKPKVFYGKFNPQETYKFLSEDSYGNSVRKELEDYLRDGLSDVDSKEKGGKVKEWLQEKLKNEQPKECFRYGEELIPEKAKEGSQWLKDCVGAEFSEKTAFIIDKDLKRSHYEKKPYSQSSKIVFSPTSGSSVLVHEMGHHLENTVSGLAQAATEFLTKRVEGYVPDKMKDITGNSGYRDSEIAVLDNFIHPYMGKISSNDGNKTIRGTEIVSMGLEMLFANPLSLLEKDPEFFSFAVSALKANRNK